MIHHVLKHAAKVTGSFYVTNPHKIAPHAAAAVQIGSMVWTHGPHVAKHTATFMAKAISKGFNLFRS